MDVTKHFKDVIIHERWEELRKSMKALRTAEHSDVILICAKKVFYAHKLILEASSPYFVTMFNCGLEENKSGKVVFQDMDPEALECILDFLYLGEVDKIQTTEQTIKVLETSHLLQLDLLVEYCCNSLIEQLSVENFVDVWNIADKFSRTTMLRKLFNFLSVTVNEVIDSPLFTTLSFEQLKSFLSLASEKEHVCEECLVGIVAWLRNNLQEREKYAKQLFEYVDTKLLSKTAVQMLLEEEKRINSSEEIQNGLEKFDSIVAHVIPSCQSVDAHLNSMRKELRIVFHSEYQFNFAYHGLDAEVSLVNNVQEFELNTMSWLPSFTLPSLVSSHTAIVNKDLVIVRDNERCSVRDSYVIINLLLYVDKSFRYFNRKKNIWIEIQKPNYVLPSKMVLASSKFLYVVGTEEETGDVIVESTGLKFFPDLEWFFLPSPQIPKGSQTQFFVYKDRLCGFYYSKGELVRIMFDHRLGKWHNKIFPTGPPGIINVTCIYRGSPDECIVLVSTTNADPLIPNFIWDPESGNWTRLPLPKGKCELENVSKLRKFYRINTTGKTSTSHLFDEFIS